MSLARAGSELASAVSFLLQLGFLEPGRPSRAAPLTPLERTIAGHLAQLGLLLPFRCPIPFACNREFVF